MIVRQANKNVYCDKLGLSPLHDHTPYPTPYTSPYTLGPEHVTLQMSLSLLREYLESTKPGRRVHIPIFCLGDRALPLRTMNKTTSTNAMYAHPPLQSAFPRAASAILSDCTQSCRSFRRAWLPARFWLLMLLLLQVRSIV